MPKNNFFICKTCSEFFTPDNDSLDLWENGEIQKPDLCLECYEITLFPTELNFEIYSDADIGL